MDDAMLAKRQEEQAQACSQAVMMADRIISKQYMGELNRYPPAPMDAVLAKVPASVISKFFKIESISYNKDENNIEKLSNVYNVLMDSEASLAAVIVSDGQKCDYYLGVKDLSGLDSGDSTHVNNQCETLYNTFLGNFPGSRLKMADSSADILEQVFENKYHTDNCIASVSGIATIKNEGQGGFIQGIDNLMDSMRGQRFSAVFISDAVKKERLHSIRLGYENLYTALTPFAATELNQSYNESDSIGDSITRGFTKGLTESLSQSQGTSTGTTAGITDSTSKRRNILSSAVVNVLGGRTGSNSSQNVSQNVNQSCQVNRQWSAQESENSSQTGTNTHSSGFAQSIQTHCENKTVSDLLEKINRRLEQVEICEDLGGWECAVYFIAEDSATALAAANAYRALICGKKSSSLEPSYINLWADGERACTEVADCLKRLVHPRFILPLEDKDENENHLLAFPGSLISGNELPVQAGLPQRSLQGLPVMEYTAFGRDVITHTGAEQGCKIHLGKIFHMGACSDSDVDVSQDSLTMHTFVTGTTGSGKSNTIYNILNRLCRKKIKFLVIEPAKGEYRNVFGGYPGVNVFGTNKDLMPLLTMDPFRFPKNIRVLSHIERLLEIFNACWSMYAAMSSFLKQALIKCYERKGWDMEESVNYDGEFYPCFSDLLEMLTELVEQSAFSQEVKSNYTGALVERVRDLTVGAADELFTGRDVGDERLFEQNCIIDISQDLSAETKSLVMGFLIIRMDEYLNAKKQSHMNLPLRHVTVLEEAHHLLRKTSFTQSQEGANMQGKSVEMISNAIAQLRSMGEGFIIADQAPKELDESVIRNTNTKIIHRIPFEEDYRIAGRSASVSEEQLMEIPRLRDGVAVVFQNNWLQPVLCQFPLFTDGMPMQYEKPVSEKQKRRIFLGDITQLLLAGRCGFSFEGMKQYTPAYIEEITAYLGREGLRDQNRIARELQEFVQKGKMPVWEDDCTIGEILLCFLGEDRLLNSLIDAATVPELADALLSEIRKIMELNKNRKVEKTAGQYLLAALSMRDKKYLPILNAYMEYVTSH